MAVVDGSIALGAIAGLMLWAPHASLAGDNAKVPAGKRPAKPAPAADGNITASLAPVVFGEADGLPAVLTPGATYTAVLQIWITPGSRKAHTKFRIGPGAPPDCNHAPLQGGVVTRVTCRFVAGKPGAGQSKADATLTASVTLTGGGGHYSRDYPHLLGRKSA